MLNFIDRIQEKTINAMQHYKNYHKHEKNFIKKNRNKRIT